MLTLKSLCFVSRKTSHTECNRPILRNSKGEKKRKRKPRWSLRSTENRVFVFHTSFLAETDDMDQICKEQEDFGDREEAERLTLDCQVAYGGLWAPTQLWTWQDRQTEITPTNWTSTGNVWYKNSVSTNRPGREEPVCLEIHFPSLDLRLAPTTKPFGLLFCH